MGSWWRHDPREPITTDGIRRAMARLLEAEEGYVLFVHPDAVANAEEALERLGWRQRVTIEPTQALREGDGVLVDAKMVAWNFVPELERASRRTEEEER